MRSSPGDAPTLRPPAYDPNAFGPYHLVRRLGIGATGIVYSARSKGSPNLVALKLLHPHLEADEPLVAAFMREARIAARVQHPAVCRVRAHGVFDGRHYIEMELLEGQTLERLLKCEIRRSPRFEALLAHVLSGLCRGLHAAHEATDDEGQPLDLVHRDVSPHNLHVLYDGSVRVIDFGIARTTLPSRKTSQGIVKGRIGYVAPEHLMQQALDRRADVWSMGVVAWELAAGCRLFRRRSLAETVEALLRSEIAAPSRVQPSVSAAFDAVVGRALSRDREQRQPSMAALADELEAVARAQGELTRVDVADFVRALAQRPG